MNCVQSLEIPIFISLVNIQIWNSHLNCLNVKQPSYLPDVKLIRPANSTNYINSYSYLNKNRNILKTSIKLPPRKNTESSSKKIIRENNSDPNPCIFKPNSLHSIKFLKIFFRLFKSLVTVRTWVLSCCAHWSFVQLVSRLLVFATTWWWAAAAWRCWWIFLSFFLIFLPKFILLILFYFIVWILFFHFFRLLRLAHWT